MTHEPKLTDEQKCPRCQGAGCIVCDPRNPMSNNYIPPEELTDEQCKFVAEFMGWWKEALATGGFDSDPLAENDSFGRILCDVRNYLSTPKGREAVMDRAVEEGWNIIHFHHIVHPDANGYVGCNIMKFNSDNVSSTGPTRFTALIEALMEARGR